MSIKKQYLKTRPVCKVTFRLGADIAAAAGEICLVGDFNAWNPQANPMKALKNGEFSLVLELPTAQPRYEFRYLVDGERWVNDAQADGYSANGVGGENSIVLV